MSKAPTKTKHYEWRITRIRIHSSAVVGRVYAPDAKQAIAKAIEEFQITNPEHKMRLVAERVS